MTMVPPPKLRKRLRKLSLKLARLGREPSDRQDYTCPLCGYEGPFKPRFGTVAIRLDAACAQCGALERHRHIGLWFRDNAHRTWGDILHFAPERQMRKLLQGLGSSYTTAELLEGVADLALNIEAIELPDASYDTIMCNHVLEHVDDAKALPELYRILRPGGQAILTFPLIASWPESYENPDVKTEADRHKHFGQSDHVRYFGWDATARIAAAGFKLTTIVATGQEAVTYGVARGDVIFLCEKG